MCGHKILYSQHYRITSLYSKVSEGVSVPSKHFSLSVAGKLGQRNCFKGVRGGGGGGEKGRKDSISKEALATQATELRNHLHMARCL